jgi:menaquinone-dependent protoporphyrinogen oxidase
MAKTLIIYSSTDGQTKKICLHLQKIIEAQGNQVSVVSIQEIKSISLATFDKIVIGASIRYGKHRQEIYKFIESNKQSLESKPNAFFSVNVVARKLEKSTPETNPYIQTFLKQTLWKPQNIAVFAGKIEYQKYKLFDRLMIKFIMKITNGPTASDTNIEFTNWRKVDEFGLIIHRM